MSVAEVNVREVAGLSPLDALYLPEARAGHPLDGEDRRVSGVNRPRVRVMAEAPTGCDDEVWNVLLPTMPDAEADALIVAHAAINRDDPSTRPRSDSSEDVEIRNAPDLLPLAGRAGAVTFSDEDDEHGPDVLTPELIPDLPMLALRINEAQSEMERLFLTGLQRAVRLGALLVEAKEQLGHGYFAPWLVANCPRLSARSARVYMRVAQHAAELDPAGGPNRQTTADLTIEGALKSLSKPKALPPPGEVDGPRLATCPSPIDAVDDDVTEFVGSRHEPIEPDGPPFSRDHQDEDFGSCDQKTPPIIGCVRVEGLELDPSHSAHLECEPLLSIAGAEDILDEKDWLDRLPLRTRLDDPTIFDEQALLWRHVQPEIGHLLRAFRPSVEETRAAAVRSWGRKRYSYRIAALTGVKPPEQWRACPSCSGTGRSRYLSKPCDHCAGAGFEIPHEGDFSEVNPSGGE